MKKITIIIILIYVPLLFATTKSTVKFPPAVTDRPGWKVDETVTGLRGNYSALEDINPNDVGFANGAMLNITKNNITITNKRIPYLVRIKSSNVVFKKCLFNPTTCSVGTPLIFTEGSAKNPVFWDCEMDYSRIPLNQVYMSIAVSIGSGSLYRCNIQGSSTGLKLNNDTDKPAVAEGCYIHGLRYKKPAHIDGITIRHCFGSGPIVIRNNKVIVDTAGATGPMFIQAEQRFINNVLIEGNLFEGTNYSLVLEYKKGGYGDNMRSINNRLNPYTRYGSGPAYGYVQGGSGWREWKDNYSYKPDAENCKGILVHMRTLGD